MKQTMKILLFISVLMPFMVDESVFFPYVAGGNFLLRTLLFITSILFLIFFLSNNDFKNQTVEKLKILIKNRLFITLISFLSLLIISTIFAFDKYLAFWGNLERSEGLVGMIYFFSFFTYSLLLFEKKDWLTFFKLNIFASLLLLAREFTQFLGGHGRPGAYLDNPSYLAGYLIFSIILSFIVFNEEKNKFFKYLSIFTIALATLGIFITQTRGTILGLFVGLIVALSFNIFTKTKYTFGKINIKKISIIIFSILIAFSVLFITTRTNEFWKKIPGVSRITDISLSDATTNTRLITANISLKAMNPKENGLKNFLIGYGVENFGSAYAKYFNPIQFDYEMKWFDRSHNKYLDVFVMNGVLGLIIYILLFIFLFIEIIKRNKDSYFTLIGLIFGISAYLVHLIFIFDQTMTYFFIFSIFGFILSTQNTEKINTKQIEENEKSKTITTSIFIVLTVFISFVYLRNDLTGYMQMKEYTRVMRGGGDLRSSINNILTPTTSPTRDIMMDLFDLVNKNMNTNNPNVLYVIDRLFYSAEAYIDKNPKDYIFKVGLSSNYILKGKITNNLDLIQKGENYFLQAYGFSPNRPEINYGLAFAYYYGGKYADSIKILERTFDLNNKYFTINRQTNEYIYKTFVKYFYEKKDRENLVLTIERLRKNDFKDIQVLDQILKDFPKNREIFPEIKLD
jgi:O-antigen ligase